MNTNTISRAKRKANLCSPDLFRWSRDNELLTNHAVRRIAHRTNASPALALAIAEMSGLMRGARHG